MRAWETKVDGAAPATSGLLSADEDNPRGQELANAVDTSGIDLDPIGGPDTDVNQLAQALARYASGGIYYQDTGSANAYVLSTPLSFVMPKAYFRGMRILFEPGNSNTGPATVNVNSIGVKKLLRPSGLLLLGGELIAGVECTAKYNPTADGGSGAFVLLPWSDTSQWVGEPQGYLTTSSIATLPIISVDALSVGTLYYSPLSGNLIPLNTGQRFVRVPFSQLILALHSSHLANTIYDVYVAFVSGVPTIMTSPAWSNSGAGTGARALDWAWLNGVRVNASSFTGRNGSTTYSVSAGMATLVASIFIDSSPGQVSCHLSWGQNRKWGISNIYNKQPLFLIAGDPNSSWTIIPNVVGPARGDAANKATAFCALADENIEAEYAIRAVNQGSSIAVGIGWNVTNNISGSLGILQSTAVITNELTADYLARPFLGIGNATALETSAGAPVLFGTEVNMNLRLRWRG